MNHQIYGPTIDISDPTRYSTEIIDNQFYAHDLIEKRKILLDKDPQESDELGDNAPWRIISIESEADSYDENIE